jgi:hypothetical protein
MCPPEEAAAVEFVFKYGWPSLRWACWTLPPERKIGTAIQTKSGMVFRNLQRGLHGSSSRYAYVSRASFAKLL